VQPRLELLNALISTVSPDPSHTLRELLLDGNARSMTAAALAFKNPNPLVLNQFMRSLDCENLTETQTEALLAPNDNGDTVIHGSCSSGEPVNLMTALMLLEHCGIPHDRIDAVLSSTNRHGHTPLYAALAGNQDVMLLTESAQFKCMSVNSVRAMLSTVSKRGWNCLHQLLVRLPCRQLSPHHFMPPFISAFAFLPPRTPF